MNGIVNCVRKTSSALLLIALAMVSFLNCEQDPADSLFDPDEQLAPQPVVLRIEPPDSSFAGAGQLTLIGENFSPAADENLVFFNQVRAQVLSVSTTEIAVRPPNIVGDSIRIRVAVQGAELFSEDRFYKLLAAVSDFGRIFEGDIAYGIASDRNGNIYYHVEGKPIKKTTPDNVTTDFATPRFLRANAFKMGPGDLLYAAPSGRIKQIATFSPDGVESSLVSLGAATLPEPRDLDFDANLNSGVVGGPILFLVKPDKTVLQAATFPVNLVSVRVFDNFVYVAGDNTSSGEAGIWRAAIQVDAVGEPELVFDAAAAPELQGARVQAITFSENGDIVIATTAQTAIFVLSQNGSLDPLYPGLIAPQIYAMSWAVEQTSIGDGQILYAVRQRPLSNVSGVFDFSQVLRISMAVRSAPYPGRQ